MNLVLGCDGTNLEELGQVTMERKGLILINCMSACAAKHPAVAELCQGNPASPKDGTQRGAELSPSARGAFWK